MRNYRKEIAERIRLSRKSREMTQTKLGEWAGLSGITISKIELGIRNIAADELIRISRALGINFDFLIDEKGYLLFDRDKNIIEALRVIPFEDYKRIIKDLESTLYSIATAHKGKEHQQLLEMVADLSLLTHSEHRPRSFLEQPKCSRKR